MSTKTLVTGVTGQVGAALLRVLDGHEVLAADRTALDLADPDSIVAALRSARPEVVLNPAAFTSVDGAEEQPQLAHAINAEAPGILAQEARRLGALLVHYSTDYVFDGSLRRPYVESDVAHPLSVYGKSKLEGEARVRASGCRHAILRTSWVYGGRTNFPMLIVEKAKKNEALRVVADQTGVPTWAADLARLTREVIRKDALGTWHASAGGEVTRYAYAVEVLRLAGIAASVEPIATSQFPSPAQRPAYSALDSSALERETGIPAIGPWRERLAAYLGGAA
ncbi:MAG TPA: dTDP-4-dehydrorhamnose reductase [Burkholderiales bacterium]|nr:dTDP-4-dehydrorhamnose reductase [Burkholderiales bacterium]